MTFVLDASATIGWFMPDEQSGNVEKLLERVTVQGALVPSLWKLEVGNAMLLAVRRQRVTLSRCNEALRQLARLPIETDRETGVHAWQSTLSFAQRFALTLYDACYLELAHRHTLPLASLDLALRKAASELDIELLS